MWGRGYIESAWSEETHAGLKDEGIMPRITRKNELKE
jgi:hypothetical protein